jgi:hypothetical protein
VSIALDPLPVRGVYLPPYRDGAGDPVLVVIDRTGRRVAEASVLPDRDMHAVESAGSSPSLTTLEPVIAAPRLTLVRKFPCGRNVWSASLGAGTDWFSPSFVSCCTTATDALSRPGVLPSSRGTGRS